MRDARTVVDRLAGGHDGSRLDHPASIDVLDEVEDVVVRGVQDDLLRIALLDHRPVAQDGDAVSQPERLVEIVGDEHDRLVELFLKPQQDVLHVGADQGVEGREGFVHEQDLGVGGESPGEPDPLLHAARELRGVMVLESGQPDPVQPLAALLLGLPDGHSLDREAVGGVLRHRLVHVQPESLEHHRHLVAPELDELLLGHREDVPTVDHDPSGCGLDQPVDVADEGGLARAGQSHDDGDLPGGDVDVDVLEPQHVVVPREKLLLGHALLDVRQHRPRPGAEDLVQTLDPDLELSHDRVPCGAAADARRTVARPGRR